MADGVDAAEDRLRHRVGQRRSVAQRVQDVQRQPADAEDRADPEGGNEELVISRFLYLDVLRGCFFIPFAARSHKRNNSVNPDTEWYPKAAARLGDRRSLSGQIHIVTRRSITNNQRRV